MDAQLGVRARLSALVAMAMLAVGLPAVTAPSAMAAPHERDDQRIGFRAA